MNTTLLVTRKELHDLINIFAGVCGYAELMSFDSEATEVQKEWCKKMLYNAERGVGIIRDIRFRNPSPPIIENWGETSPQTPQF